MYVSYPSPSQVLVTLYTYSIHRGLPWISDPEWKSVALDAFNQTTIHTVYGGLPSLYPL